MTAATPTPNEYSLPTTNWSGDVDMSSPGTREVPTFHFTVQVMQPDAIDQKTLPVAEILARSESIPERAAALAKARMRFVDKTGLTGGIRGLRLRSGLSQVGLARLMGTSQPHVARIEAGDHTVNLDTVRKLADALGTDVAAIDAALRKMPEGKE